MWTDDPVADYHRYSDEQERKLERLPVCDYCGEHITDDHYFYINDEAICPDCMDSYFRKEVDDFA